MSSESEDSIERPNGPKPKSLDSRCSPSSINEIFVALKDKKIKLDEIDKMGFGGLKHIPKWSVDQESYLYLAKNFDLTNFQHSGVKHISGCMYALLILYFQRMTYGPLELCKIQPPWVKDCDDMEDGGDDPLNKKRETEEKKSHNKKRKEGEDDVIFDETEEIDDGQNKEGTFQHIQTWVELAEELKGHIEKHIAAKERWKEIEEIIDNDPNCNIYEEFNSSESQGRPSFSLEFSEDSPSTIPIEKIENISPISQVLPTDDPVSMILTKGLSEAQTKKIYSWVMRSSKQEYVMNETIASFEGKFKYSLSRDDMMTLTPREWISNNVRL
ncbi:hypothetical protein PIB30_018783 [Stylosanthes scabra]|uniref:Uncharacterized protein n=1 Tax=Stylosanthes scabra TaxID=79078 RepID=A0ABU6R897_9FABA|nr:hypothetical protein [Stylosanthes scabra]